MRNRTDGPPDRRTGPFAPGWWKRAVPYAPFVEYRGRVLWHHLSDAYEDAAEQSRRNGIRYQVKSQRVPGWDHLLWWVRVADDWRPRTWPRDY